MQTLLVLNINPELEEDMVDYLLASPLISGFTSFQVYGHGSFPNMSLSEQVSGRRKRIQFESLIDKNGVNEILSGLSERVGNDIFYWEQPVSGIGRIG